MEKEKSIRRPALWRAGFRAVAFSLLCGGLLTLLLYAGAWELRRGAREQVAEGATTALAFRLHSTLETLEEKLNALRVLWLASHQVDPEEWSRAWKALWTDDLTAWLAAGVAQALHNERAPSSGADGQEVSGWSFPHLTVVPKGEITEQVISDLIRSIWTRTALSSSAGRFVGTNGHYVVIGLQMTPLDGQRQSLHTATWIWGVVDVDDLLTRLLKEGSLCGRLSLVWQGGGHSWVVNTSPGGQSAKSVGGKGFVRSFTWAGHSFAVELFPRELRAGSFHEWLPRGALALGGMLTVAFVIGGYALGRLRNNILASWRRLCALLHERDRRYRAVFANIRQPLLIVSANREIQELNPAAKALFGENLTGHRFCKVCALASESAGEGCSACRWFEGKEAAEQDCWEKESQILGADRQVHDVVARISRVKIKDHENSYVVALQDVTRERAIQRKLEKSAADLEAANVRLRAYSEEIENAARAKITLLASMSHEIRTPLSVIIGYARLLGEEIAAWVKRAKAIPGASPATVGSGEPIEATDNGPGASLSPELLGEAVQGLIRNSEHLLEMINTVLDFSKLESGEMRVERIAMNPVAIADDVVRMLTSKARQKGLTLELEVRGPIPEVIHSDPTRLRQILLNLTDNAIKFTPQGRVWIEIELDRTPAEGPMLEFRVCDTGVGMSPDQIGRLFQAFRQAEVSTYRQFGGTGLGLMISRRLARLLGGDIWVESTPGKGTTFHVRIATGPLENLQDETRSSDHQAGALPSASSRPQEAGPERAVGRDGVAPLVLKGRVLVAEDCADNRRLIRHYLEKAGLSVELAENGREALEKYHRAQQWQKPYDLILMDVEMPELDGVAAVRRLRTGGCTIPILAMTAHSDPGCVEQFLAAGFSGYLPKPLYREQLLEAIGTFLVKRYPGSHLGPSSLPSGWTFFADRVKGRWGDVGQPGKEPGRKGAPWQSSEGESPPRLSEVCPK